jgi:two-component system heavy metal sensor histidine kinase CusS
VSPRPHSIRNRLTTWFAAQAFFCLSLACLTVYLVTAWSFGQKQNDELGHKAQLVRHLLEESAQDGDLSVLRHKLEDFFSLEDGVSLTIARQPDGSVFFRSTRPAGGHWIQRDFESTDGGTPLSIRIGIDIARDRQLLQRLAWTLLAACVLGTALVSLTGAQLVRRGLRPLKALAERTAALTPDHINQPIDAEAFAQELHPWITQFNALLLRVQKAYVQLESFNADVAHELRTPLANLIGSTEVALSRPRPNDELQAVLASNLEEIGRLSGIVTDMLFLSQAERGAPLRVNKAGTSLAAQARDVIDFHEAVLEEAGLSATVTGDATAEVDASLVRRALSNLLGNAIRFAAPASRIGIEIGTGPGEATLTVVNRGEPIAAETLPRLFERFYRADPARDRSARHHGLGLSIVEAIARMHGGRVFATSAHGETRIGFAVPLTR